MPYQQPSGWTLTIGPCLQTPKQRVRRAAAAVPSAFRRDLTPCFSVFQAARISFAEAHFDFDSSPHMTKVTAASSRPFSRKRFAKSRFDPKPVSQCCRDDSPPRADQRRLTFADPSGTILLRIVLRAKSKDKNLPTQPRGHVATMHRHETLLQVLTSESPTSRVSLWMVRCEFSGESRLRMRQESYSDDVGWFTQTHLDLTPDQLSQLKGGVASDRHSTRARAFPSTTPVRQSATADAAPAPRDLLPMSSVMAG